MFACPQSGSDTRQALAGWQQFVRPTGTPSCRKYQQVIDEFSQPAEGAKAIHFDSAYAKSVWGQYTNNLWRFNITYWRTTEYNSVRFLLTCIIGLVFGYPPPLSFLLPTCMCRPQCHLLRAVVLDMAFSVNKLPRLRCYGGSLLLFWEAGFSICSSNSRRRTILAIAHLWLNVCPYFQ